MKRFIAIIAVLTVLALTAVAGAPAITTGTTGTTPAPAKKTAAPTGILRLASTPGAIEALGTSSTSASTGMSTKPSKPKTTTAPVGTK
ncbi:MAG: hypothetical protein Q8N26_34655 [Myxococcales bacterium]|nr:hypothetical protein [Myxococcales bacterium]